VNPPADAIRNLRNPLSITFPDRQRARRQRATCPNNTFFASSLIGWFAGLISAPLA
jgi:hypothetical protein